MKELLEEYILEKQQLLYKIDILLSVISEMNDDEVEREFRLEDILPPSTVTIENGVVYVNP